MYNTIIVGAGPVGSYLASKLTQLGHKVLVLEKKEAPGQNICCTGIISKECFVLLNVAESATLRRANSAKFFVPSGKCLRLWHKNEVAVITDRPALEQTLVNKALATGTNYRFSTQVTGIESTSDCLLISTNSNGGKRVFEAQTAVIATGYGSDLPKNLGLGKIRHLSIGAQAEVKIIDIDEVEIYLDQQVAPGGFAWLVPTKDDKGFVGLMTRQQPEWHLNQFLLTLQTHGKVTSTEATRNYAIIPLQPLPKTYTDRILVVGEAAGQVKPITGGGIYYGILCADIAASVLHQALTSVNFSAANLSAYQKQWQKKLRRELTIGYWAQYFWAKLSNNHIEYLFNIAQEKHLPEFINTIDDFSFDWHSKVFLQTALSLLPFAKARKEL